MDSFEHIAKSARNDELVELVYVGPPTYQGPEKHLLTNQQFMLAMRDLAHALTDMQDGYQPQAFTKYHRFWREMVDFLKSEIADLASNRLPNELPLEDNCYYQKCQHQLSAAQTILATIERRLKKIYA